MRVVKQIYLWGLTASFAVPITVATLPIQAADAPSIPNPSAVSGTVSGIETLDMMLRQGQKQIQQQNYRDAITTFNRAILRAPEQAAPYFNRGLVRFQLEDEFGALDDFDDALLRNPRLAEAYLYRGSLLLSLGDQSAGLVDLRQAAQLFSEQNKKKSYQKAVSLIKQFNPEIAP